MSIGVPGTIDLTFNQGGLGFNNTTRVSFTQSDGKILVGGDFSSYNDETAYGLIRLNDDGSIDTTFNTGSGFDGGIFCINQQSDGKILLGGAFTSYDGNIANYIIRLNIDGSIDDTFLSGNGFDSNVNSIYVQPDGKILVGGNFQFYNEIYYYNIIRLNTDGNIDTSFGIEGDGFNGTVYDIDLLNNGGIIVVGQFTVYQGYTANGVIKLFQNGTIDVDFLSNIGTGFNNPVYTIAIDSNTQKIYCGGGFTEFNGNPVNHIVQIDNSGFYVPAFSVSIDDTVNKISLTTDGKVLIGGRFGVVNSVSCNHIARLYDSGLVDSTFEIGTGFDGNVYGFDIDLYGNIIVVGLFSKFDGNDVSFIAKLYGGYYYTLGTPGTIDTGFDTQVGLGGAVFALGLQSNKKLLVGGTFSLFNNDSIPNNLIRLNTNGSLDNTFNFGGNGFDDKVSTITIQTDGKILVGGTFTEYDVEISKKIIRLNSDGSIDDTFQHGNIVDGSSVLSIKIQTDEKILIGGDFTGYDSSITNYFCRLNTDGTLDTSFDYSNCFNDKVNDIFIQSDGKILVGGPFNSYSGIPANNIIRLNPDLTIDESFTYGEYLNGSVNTIDIQSNGKILIGGEFTDYSGTSLGYIARLNSDGTLDTTFNSDNNGFDNQINKIVIQNNDKIVVGGNFTNYNHETENYLIRLNIDGSKDNSFITESGFNNPITSLISTSTNEIYVGGQFTYYNI